MKFLTDLLFSKPIAKPNILKTAQNTTYHICQQKLQIQPNRKYDEISHSSLRNDVETIFKFNLFTLSGIIGALGLTGINYYGSSQRLNALEKKVALLEQQKPQTSNNLFAVRIPVTDSVTTPTIESTPASPTSALSK